VNCNVQTLTFNDVLRHRDNLQSLNLFEEDIHESLKSLKVNNLKILFIFTAN